MENRFGVKDFLLLLLLVVVIIMVGLAMKQYDRQYQLVRDIQSQSHDQLRELEAIHRILESGGGGLSTSRDVSAQSNSTEDAFPTLWPLRKEGKYDEGDWFIENFGAPVGKFTPLIAGDLYAYILQNRVIETLAYQDCDTLKYVPLLATSWTITDNRKAWHEYVDPRLKNGKSEEEIGGEADCPPAVIINFKLRQGVTFSDGSPFSADDVVFTYDWIMNPKIDAP